MSIGLQDTQRKTPPQGKLQRDEAKGDDASSDALKKTEEALMLPA
jgi:hypothetical protein